MNEAGVAPPGVTPSQMPTKVPRMMVTQNCGSFFQVCHTTNGLILALRPSNCRPFSIVTRISPMPNRPMTAIRKWKPVSSVSVPNVRRKPPVISSVPTLAKAKPNIIAEMTLNGDCRPMPTKLQNVSR